MYMMHVPYMYVEYRVDQNTSFCPYKLSSSFLQVDYRQKKYQSVSSIAGALLHCYMYMYVHVYMPLYTSYCTQVDIETFNKATSSSHPHTARGTPLSSRLPSPFPHPSPLHHVTTGTHHIVTPSAPIAVGLNDIVNDPNEVNHFKVMSITKCYWS